VSRATHLACFVGGCAVAAAVSAVATPQRSTAIRYQSLDTFAQTLSIVAQQYVQPVSERQLIYAAARGMVKGLDPYSAFFTPSEYRRLREDTEGEWSGIGVVLGPGGPDDAMPDALAWPIIDEVIPGSPADQAGLVADDRLLSIDGVATAGVAGDDFDERYWDSKLRGTAGSRVVVQALHVDPATQGATASRTIELVRAQVKIPSVAAEVLSPRIGYLSIRRFQEATGADTTAALRQLAASGGAEVILLDLRSDSGGLIDEAMAVADEFIDDGIIVTIRGRTSDVEIHKAHRGGTAVTARVIALVNAETASAAEILAGALQDHRRATILGMKTYGKGVIQTYFDLDGGAGLKLTTNRYVTPADHEVEGHGIVPDVEVPEFAAEVVVAGAGASLPADPVQPVGNRAILEARLEDDYQLRIAYQTAQRWLGSK
jgi:carboxyl-terminal processing protease